MVVVAHSDSVVRAVVSGSSDDGRVVVDGSRAEDDDSRVFVVYGNEEFYEKYEKLYENYEGLLTSHHSRRTLALSGPTVDNRSIMKKNETFPVIAKENIEIMKTNECFRVIAKEKIEMMMKTNMTFPVIAEEKINLTDKEKQIFDLLSEVVLHLNLKTQIRVAGGWVRDRLLGKECHDIDIALDNMSGNEFCKKVNEYLTSTGEQIERIFDIPSNPDQSKHLETARMCLFDIWIDFVNLRSEDYTGNSRIPTMKFGSVEQDAYRRDITINSLFYNIHTCLVEDFTGRGLDDLKSGKIATPLQPKQTFLDDPLRVLRAIRFSVRFGFQMVEDLKVAALDNDVKSAFLNKISRERIGREIDLMVSGNQPDKAMAYISEFGLFWVVFTPPLNCKPLIYNEDDKIYVKHMDSALRFIREVGCNFTDEQRRLYLYASLFIPLSKTVYTDNKKKTIPVVNYIFRTSLKLNASYSDDIMRLYNGVEKFLSLIPLIFCGEDVLVDWESEIISVSQPLKARILLGLVVREMKGLWRAALMLTSLVYRDSVGEGIIVGGKVEKGRGVFMELEEEILKLGLEKVWEMKPLINGKDIMRHLGIEKGGPLVSKWQRRMLQWQLAYPCGSVEECVDWMTSNLHS